MNRNHDFTNIHWGQEFSIEAPLDSVRGTVIGQGNLKSGDCVVLCIQCRVSEVERYIDTPEIWQAKISVEKPIALETVTQSNTMQAIQNSIAQFRESLTKPFAQIKNLIA
ncbi:hypothetical protein [Altericista sp. CCNU0014]|uniref:hypothetical protein n=1 Tax=Altericista sp. CCNU0014 TaxID=3082949 RepID=UPI00384C3517